MVVAVIGGGPAGLMAAETLSQAGVSVEVFDAMPSVGRKFLMAGKGGLNLSHAEPLDAFLDRYGARRAQAEGWIRGFDADALRAWAAELGIETFVGTSGRIFPKEMKAAPLLRAWVHRLRAAGVCFHMRHRWLGWNDQGALRFATPAGEALVAADAVVLALGGGSWPQLGSDGAWVPLLERRGLTVVPLKPANCGFDVDWTAFFRDKFAGEPVKSVAVTFAGVTRRGEFMVTEHGVEGGLIYAFSAALRDAITAYGHADVKIDLLPDKSLEQVQTEVERPRGSRSLSSHLQSRLGLHGVKTGLLNECAPDGLRPVPPGLSLTIKHLPLRLVAPRPMAEAISTAGGLDLADLNADLMIRDLPGVFCAGEMLDWEAPTGGYLLTACFASGRVAGRGVLSWLAARQRL